MLVCGDPGIPSNGTRLGTQFSVGSTVEYKCNEGFKLVGTRTRTCLITQRWSGFLPYCEAVEDTSADECSVEGEVIFDSCSQSCICKQHRLTSCCRQRFDFVNLSPQDQQRYIDAVKMVSSDPLYKSRYDTLIAKHKSSFDTVAQSTDPQVSQFFMWNRYFLHQYENLLREIDCNITIPYWDWTALPQMPYRSRVFDPKIGFGDASNPNDSCVSNGPFSYPSFQVTPSAGGRCLEREYKTQTFPTKAIIEKDVLTLPVEEFDVFHRFLQIFIFTNIRCFVGGQMCSKDAANDPLFLLHVAQTDFIFTRWQESDPFKLNAHFASDSRPLVLSDGALVSDYSNNKDLPNSLRVCYIMQELKNHLPSSGEAAFSAMLLAFTSKAKPEMECAVVGGDSMMGDVALGEKEKEFMKKMCKT